MDGSRGLNRMFWAIVFLACLLSFAQQGEAQDVPEGDQDLSVAPLELVHLDTQRTHRRGYHFNVVDVIPEGILVGSGLPTWAQRADFQLAAGNNFLMWLLPMEHVNETDSADFARVRDQVAKKGRPDDSHLLQLEIAKEFILQKIFLADGQANYFARSAKQAKGICKIDYDSVGNPKVILARDAPEYLKSAWQSSQTYFNEKDRAYFVFGIADTESGFVDLRAGGHDQWTLVTIELNENGWSDSRMIELSASDGNFVGMSSGYAIFSKQTSEGLQLGSIDFDGNRRVLYEATAKSRSLELSCQWSGNSCYVNEQHSVLNPLGAVVEFDAKTGKKLRTIKPPKGYSLIGDVTVAKDGTIYMHGKRSRRKDELASPKTPLEHRRKTVLKQIGSFALILCPPEVQEFQVLAEIPASLRKRTPKNLIVTDDYIYFADRAPDFLYPAETFDPKMGEAVYRLRLPMD